MKKYVIYIAWMLAALFVVGCEDLEDTYSEYAGDGMIRYVGKNSDLTVDPGWYRLKVKWKDNLDAAIAKVKITYQAETDAEPTVIYVEPKDITESANLMDSIYLENLSDAVYTINVSNVSVDSVESMVTTAYARPYTESHEDLRSFSRGIINFYPIDNRKMVVYIDEENSNIKKMVLNFYDMEGNKHEWDIRDKMRNAWGAVDLITMFLLPEEEGVNIDFTKPLTIDRRGLLDGCIDTITFVPDTLDMSERVWSAGFTRWLTNEFGANYTEEDINSVTRIELDYDLVTMRDLFYFPNLKEVVLGKNRYIEERFANVNPSTTDEYTALLTLQFLRDTRGVTTERYNDQYFGEFYGYKWTELLAGYEIDADLITEMGNSNMDNIPAITPLDTTGWEITCSDTLYNGYKSNGAGYLLDGRVDTYFEPGLTGSATVIEVEFDMKETRTLNGIKVVQPTTTLDPDDSGTSAEFETFMSYLLQSVKVEVSADGYTWEDATHEDGGITIGNAPGEITFIELPEPKQVQYIRFTVASQMVQSTREGVALFSLRLADFIPY